MVGSMRIVAHFVFLSAKRQRKKSIFKMFIFDFLKKISECITFPGLKTTTFLEISTSQTFYFSVTSSSGEELDLKIGKIFSKIMFFSGAPRP